MCEEVSVSLGTEFTAALNQGAVSKEGDTDTESAMNNACPLWALEFCCTIGILGVGPMTEFSPHKMTAFQTFLQTTQFP